MRQVACALICVAAVMLGGCANPQDKITQQVENVGSGLKPVVEKAVTDLATRTGNINVNGNLTNPGYVTRGYGVVGTGFFWSAEIGTVGVAGSVAGAMQADNQASPKPTLPIEPSVVDPPAKANAPAAAKSEASPAATQ